MRDFKRPDLKKSRYRPGVHHILKKSFYDQLRTQQVPLANLSDQQIKDIIVAASEILQQQVCFQRDGVELPEQLGYLFIGSVQTTRKRSVDYKKSIELGKEVHHHNWETDCLTGKIFYSNYGSKYRFRFHELWKFQPARQFKKRVSKVYLLDYLKFIKVENWARVSKLFRTNLYQKSKAVLNQA